MTATQEALEAMKKAEENWDKMVNETVQVSGQFIKECEAFQKECQEAFSEEDLKNTK